MVDINLLAPVSSLIRQTSVEIVTALVVKIDMPSSITCLHWT